MLSEPQPVDCPSERGRNYTPPEGSVLRPAGASCGKRMIARSVPAPANHHRGSYTSPALAAASYPFVDLPSENILQLQAVLVQQVYKIILYLPGLIEYNENNDKSKFVTLFGGELVMIKLKMSIEDISEYQTGILPKSAVKIETPQSIEEMMKKAAPIAAVLCVLMFVTMLCKTVMNKTVVISHVFILIGFCLGYICLVIHEWLHGIVYPRNALVTIGKITGKISFVALASYPLKRRRFIVMCLLPFVLGIIPLLIFIVSPAEYRELNGLMFGMSCMGMVSPFPDVYNVFIVLKNANKKDAIMFYKNDMYKVS